MNVILEKFRGKIASLPSKPKSGRGLAVLIVESFSEAADRLGSARGKRLIKVFILEMA